MEYSGKVFVLIAGGTWAMKRDSKTGRWVPDIPKAKKNLKRVYPELHSRTDVQVLEDADDSSQFTPRHWIEIGRQIIEHLNERRYKGVVVLHGTDTLHYTAAALSFILNKSPVPVVLTGAQKSLLDTSPPPSDFPSNFQDSMRVAFEADLAEVCIVFNHRILRGTRSRKMRIGGVADYYNAFESINCPDLGEIGTKEIRLGVADRKRRLKDTSTTLKDAALEPNVKLVKVFPGIRPDVIDHLVDDECSKGIVLETLGDAGFRAKDKFDSFSLTESIHHAFERKVPVVICSQAPFGEVIGDYGPYEKLKNETILGHDMLPEVALAKLMWILAKMRTTGAGSREGFLSQIRSQMHKPIAYEIKVGLHDA